MLLFSLAVVTWIVYNLSKAGGAFEACQAAYTERLPTATELKHRDTRYFSWDHQRIQATAGAEGVVCDVEYRNSRWIVTDLSAGSR